MLAKRMMVKEPATARPDACVGEALKIMRQGRFRMLPVVDGDGRVLGVFSTFSIIEHIVPEYIVSGDLDSVSYAPDIGILRSKYPEVMAMRVEQAMTAPLLIAENESLLSIAASLVNFGRHEYALVVDKTQHLLGIISAGDILDRLRQLGLDGKDTDGADG
ncbi:MAG: CBS domain-containing protein [Mariprofundaceae bacterium]